MGRKLNIPSAIFDNPFRMFDHDQYNPSKFAEPNQLMKPFYLIVATILSFSFSARSQEKDLFYLYGSKLVNDSASILLTHNHDFYRKSHSGAPFSPLLQNKEAQKMVLYTTKKGKPVELYFFPGASNKKALIVGGMHGSELSSIEVAKALIEKLSTGEKPYYNVLVIPSLFPENAYVARENKQDRIAKNSGRYTNEHAADPNRQMPPLGKPFLPGKPLDAMQREIEGENAALLQLIQTYLPDRLLSIHAIKDRSKAGIFADPRTDCSGFALGFESDKALALLMAQYIHASGGACPGNNMNEEPTALYYLDPLIAEAGQKQERSSNGSNVPGRGHGVSLGSWCSTAVCHTNETFNRPAIRTFTMEFPGYQLPSEYKEEEDRERYKRMIQVYATSIQNYFLQSFYVEESASDMIRYAAK